MTEEGALAKAYAVLGIDGGSSLETINLCWKRLAMVWHSDRFPTEDGKAYADEELKKINNERDVLKKHFASGHTETNQCACKPKSGTSQAGRAGTGQGPGPGKRRTTQETNAADVAEAKRHNQERARAADESRKKAAAEAAAKAAQTAPQTAGSNPVDQVKSANDEALRWKVTLGTGAAWIALSLFGCVGMGLKHWWHDASFKLQNMFPAHTEQCSSPVLEQQPQPVQITPPSQDNIGPPPGDQSGR
ncbi:MAG: J domain-containing protein [Cyanobacteria bacterium REEB67]|nr:J domain-containing protein [Cyanobacteria bacterium REEB67]